MMDFDLIVEPDIYTPSIDGDGNYIDYVYTFQHGLRCPCNGKKDHVFLNKTTFLTHTKSKTHQKWITLLNANKANYYVENIKLHEMVNSQKQIIARLQKEQDTNVKIIYNLTKKIEINPEPTVMVDLMNFVD